MRKTGHLREQHERQRNDEPQDQERDGLLRRRQRWAIDRGRHPRRWRSRSGGSDWIDLHGRQGTKIEAVVPQMRFPGPDPPSGRGRFPDRLSLSRSTTCATFARCATPRHRDPIARARVLALADRGAACYATGARAQDAPLASPSGTRKEPTVTAKQKPTRLPRSLRKHVRNRKAILRRTLGETEAKKAIDHLLRSLRSGGGSPIA